MKRSCLVKAFVYLCPLAVVIFLWNTLYLRDVQLRHWDDYQSSSLPQHASAGTTMSMAELRAQAHAILAERKGKFPCDSAALAGPDNHQIFYNRIGKAGSSTISTLFQKTIYRRNGVQLHLHLDEPSKRGSDEFMTQQGELELIQKIVGRPRHAWMDPSTHSVFVYHAFFLNFTRYGLRLPMYINLLREPAERYVSQKAFWDTLPDIGPLTREHGATLEECLQQGQQHLIGCPPLNYQTSYLCGHELDCRDPPDDASFLQAVRHVVENYAVVGTLEQLNDFKEQIVTMFPEFISPQHRHLWHPTSTTAAVNVNKHKHVNESLLGSVRQANKYDAILYEIVQQISAQRLAACRRKSTTNTTDA